MTYWDKINRMSQLFHIELDTPDLGHLQHFKLVKTRSQYHVRV